MNMTKTEAIIAWGGLGLLVLVFAGTGHPSTDTATTAPTPATHFVKGALNIACRHRETWVRDMALFVSGNIADEVAYLDQQQRTGECSALYDGARVRIEQKGGGMVCVALAGTSDACKWAPENIVQ
jgi:hypothetical protein